MYNSVQGDKGLSMSRVFSHISFSWVSSIGGWVVSDTKTAITPPDVMEVKLPINILNSKLVSAGNQNSMQSHILRIKNSYLIPQVIQNHQGFFSIAWDWRWCMMMYVCTPLISPLIDIYWPKINDHCVHIHWHISEDYFLYFKSLYKCCFVEPLQNNYQH